MLLLVTEILFAVKRRVGLEQADSDLPLLSLVADVLQTIQTCDGVQAHFTAASRRQYGEAVAFRGKLLLEFAPSVAWPPRGRLT